MINHNVERGKYFVRYCDKWYHVPKLIYFHQVCSLSNPWKRPACKPKNHGGCEKISWRHAKVNIQKIVDSSSKSSKIDWKSCRQVQNNRVLGDEAPQFDQFLQLYGKVIDQHCDSVVFHLWVSWFMSEQCDFWLWRLSSTTLSWARGRPESHWEWVSTWPPVYW